MSNTALTRRWDPVTPAIRPEDLGAKSFRERYGIKYGYLAGAMYKGIASVDLVTAMAKAGLLGFLGTAGLRRSEIENRIHQIQSHLDPGDAYGINLICHLDDPDTEMDLVDLYIRHQVSCVEASAFLILTPALVRYRLAGLTETTDGSVCCSNRIIAKVSRPEVALAFLSPAPTHIVERLVRDGKVTDLQARLSEQVPMSYDITVEADSGGHTDRGVASVLLPSIQALKQSVERQRGYPESIHVGLAGGIGTPQAAAAAFTMGADYVLTGSINQCTVEADISDAVKDLLETINVQDTEYAPAGDMFELGAKVQVLKKGVLFPARANKLFALYSQYDAWEEIPEKVRTQLEEKYFGRSYSEVWNEVADHHGDSVVAKATNNPKQKLALVFRWYFAHSTRLAFEGNRSSQVDFQVHTGPALGAFNQWVKGSELESWRSRHVADVADMMMQETAALLARNVLSLTSAAVSAGCE